MTKIKLALILSASLILHILIFISMAEEEEVQFQEQASAIDARTIDTEEIREETKKDSVTWNSNSAKVSGGIFEGSTVSLTDLEPVIAEKDHIIYWSMEALILVLASAIFHAWAFLTFRAPTSRSRSTR